MYMKNAIKFLDKMHTLLPAARRMLCLSLIAVLVTCCGNQDENTWVTTENPHSSDDNGNPAAQDTLEVCFLKVGKADAIVLMCRDETMVIDCGEEDDGREVLACLKSRGVKEVDVLVITHFDKDHVGGAEAWRR